MHEDATCNDLQEIITQAIDEIKQKQGENFSLFKINLAELERRTGLSRSRLRRLKENNFIVTPHGRTGQKATATVLTGYSGIIDRLLQKGVTNSSVCFERLQEAEYTGGLTTVKTYIADHRDLVPPKPHTAALGLLFYTFEGKDCVYHLTGTGADLFRPFVLFTAPGT